MAKNKLGAATFIAAIVAPALMAGCFSYTSKTTEPAVVTDPQRPRRRPRLRRQLRLTALSKSTRPRLFRRHLSEPGGAWRIYGDPLRTRWSLNE